MPAFILSQRSDMPIPVLLAVPHAGRSYPEALTARMRKPDFAKIRLEDRRVDMVASGAARSTGAALLTAEAPRAMIDLNRAPEDVDWDMVTDAPAKDARHSAANRRARSGLGLVPRRLSGLGEIWTGPMKAAELHSRIRRIHAPYHTALASHLGAIADRWGAALLIDIHSMPPLPQPSRGGASAKFVIGDRFGASAADAVVAGALRYLADQGCAVAHNRPYAGGYVLDRHAAPQRNIHAIQLEICRSLYLDDAMQEPVAGIEPLTVLIAGLVRKLGEDVARMGSGNRYALAAE